MAYLHWTLPLVHDTDRHVDRIEITVEVADSTGVAYVDELEAVPGSEITVATDDLDTKVVGTGTHRIFNHFGRGPTTLIVPNRGTGPAPADVTLARRPDGPSLHGPSIATGNGARRTETDGLCSTLAVKASDRTRLVNGTDLPRRSALMLLQPVDDHVRVDPGDDRPFHALVEFDERDLTETRPWLPD